MFNNKHNKVIVGYFERNVRQSISELDPIIYREHQKIVEEMNSRGLLASGMTAPSILKILQENVITSCENSLSLIETFQIKNKLTVKEKELKILSEIYTSSYISFYLDKTENVYESMKRYLGEESAINNTNQILINSVTNRIQNLVENKIEDIKIYNKVQQEDTSVKTARRNTIKTIIFTLLVAIATIYFNVFYNK